jgi:hypothetical protein
MRSLAFTLCLAVFTTCQVNAQSLYKDGFILTSPFDTLKGEIKYASYNKASLRCTFRNEAGEENVYLPSEIFGYGIEDQLFFRSKSIGTDKVLFLEVVYQGTMILYAYRDQYQRNFFYLENPTSTQMEILNQKTIRNEGKTLTIRVFEEVLREMLPKSELITDEISEVEFGHSALSNLLLSYDERYAAFQGRIYQGFQKRWPPKFGAFVSTGNSRLTINGFNDQAFSHTVGLGVKFQKEVSRGTGRLHLDLDLFYHYESYQNAFFSFTDFANEGTIISNGFNITLFATDLGIQGPYEVQNTLNLERHVLNMPINLKYFFPSEKWTVSLNGGIDPSLAVAQSGNLDGQVIQNDQVVLGINSRLEIPKFRPGLNFGFGLYLHQKNTWFIDFQHSPAWLDQGNFNFSTSTFRLGYVIE